MVRLLHRRVPTALLAGAALLLAIAPGVARATTSIPSFDLEQLVPEEDASGSLFVGTGYLPAPGTWRLSLDAMYEYKPLTIYDGSKLVAIPVRNRVTGILGGAFVLFSRFELSFSLPYVLEQNGDHAGDAGFNPVTGTGLGTPFIGGRVAVLQQSQGMPLDLSVELNVGVPIRGAAQLGQDNGWQLLPALLLSRQAGPLLISAEARFLVRPTAQLNGGPVSDDVAINAAVTTLGHVVRGELSVLSDIPLSGQPAALEILPGVRFELPQGFELHAGAGPGFGSTPGVPAFRGLLGVSYNGAPPPAPEPTPAVCPECPACAECAPAPICPAPPPAPAPAPVVVPAPPPAPPADADHDGVPDADDQCPNEAGPASNHGCPVKQVEITDDKIALHEKILFATGESTILPVSFPVLDQVVKVLQNHPEIERIVVEGHTDNEGGHQRNMKLSRERARAVRAYLIKAGIAHKRVLWKGYGPDKPVASNETEAGRETNRRVEISIDRWNKKLKRTSAAHTSDLDLPSQEGTSR